MKVWFNLRFDGLENIATEGPAIVACNHISYLDQFSYGLFVEKAGRRPRFLAKAELFTNPLVAKVLHGTGQIPVNRGTGDLAPLRSANEALGKGKVVVLFPEGTVTKRPDFLPQEGRTGVARLALMSGVPVTPLASWGSQHVWQKSGRGSLKFGRPVWLKAGPPIDFSSRGYDPEDPEVWREITAEVMDALTDLAVWMRARYPERWA
jgi:1-acyl-sn-glycerol-3-phosphate acyltransferase